MKFTSQIWRNTGIGYEVTAEGLTDLNVWATYYGATFAPAFACRSSRGTQAAPVALAANDPISIFAGRGFDGNAFTNSRILIYMRTAEAWTPVATGTHMDFYTCPVGTIVAQRQMRLTDAGNLGIGTGANPVTSKLQVVGLPVFANNAAALGGGLTAGAFYRTGADPDLICVVH